MASAAKGGFPGKPRKRIHKKAVKFRKKLQKLGVKDVMRMCSFLNEANDQFENIFDDDNDQDIEFVGFSSEECGLCAYKRVSKPISSPLKSGDILGSHQPSVSKDKIVTRRSFALDSKKDADVSTDAACSSSLSVKLTPIETKTFSKESALSSGAGSAVFTADVAFTKYMDTKLDFHRLSKKARNRESYEECSAEEQAKRKDTSTASLKYASEIYLAKGDSTALESTKSPIKPATFIPPASLTVDKDDASGEEKKKGARHPQVLAKALLSRANRSLKSISVGLSTDSKSSKTTHGFNLPSKSIRSSRIIKANRKYMDDVDISTSNRKFAATEINSASEVKGESVAEEASKNEAIARAKTETLKTQKKLILRPSRFKVPVENNPETRFKVPHEGDTKTPFKVPDENSPETRFKVPDENSTKTVSVDTKLTSKSGSEKLSRSKSRSFIKRARFKHPTSSDALVLGTESDKETIQSPASKNPIREATFTPPAFKTRSRESKKKSHSKSQQPSEDLSDLGFSSSVWEKLYDPHGKKWTMAAVPEAVPRWTRQELHNILHGAHTFGSAWSSIARRYHFHQWHRDWMSICNKAKRAQSLGLLNESNKVKSSILLQLKPKLSDNPNFTVFTQSELKVRGLTTNIPCSFNSARMKCVYDPPKGTNQLKVLEPHIGHPSNNRIFGTKLSGEFRWKKVHLFKIPKEDLYLGLSAQSMLSMLRPRKYAKKNQIPWAPWEIHNILHGIHYFGVGSWLTISSVYYFLEGHDNIDVRARFKSVCCRGLIVANDVRADILPKLHVVLSKRGKEYFRSKKVSVTICSLSKRSGQPLPNPCYSPKTKTQSEGSDVVVDGIVNDDLTISPARRAVHIFGSVPLWDDQIKPELIGPDDDAAPVINALESSLRKNLSSSMSRRRASYDDVITSPTSYDVPQPTQLLETSPDGVSKRSRSKSESQTTPVKNKSRGPRIKHVCRRASLVKGLSLDTTEDEHPHLTALPLEEREKIFAESEKRKDDEASSDESIRVKSASKPPAVSIVKKKSRKRHASRRCGNCSACNEPPCQHCDVCRCLNSEERAAIQVPPCKNRKPCITVTTTTTTTVENSIPPKKQRRSFTSSQPGSRKSSRLQQQLVPLVAPPVVEPLNLATVEAPPFLNATTLPYDNLSSPDAWDDFSPFSKESFDRLNAQSQSLIKIDHWKETYDHDLLWKNRGQALITSQPAPPRRVCLLCGSRGHPDDKIDRLVHCCSCCESFHAYCADASYEHPLVKKAMETGSWFCKRCKLCSVCGASGKMMECRVCMKNFHSDCLGPTYPTKFIDNVWICMQCITCKSCGAAKPGRLGHLGGSNATSDYTMCQKCGDLYDKGNYCSVCQRCYSDEDYDCRMIQCAKCKRWIHSQCENLTVEMYTHLSHMPDSVQYKCPACDGRSLKLKESGDIDELSGQQVNVDKIRSSLSRLPPPLWRKLIHEDIQHGLETIIMALFHNKAACSVLKKNESVSEERDVDGNLNSANARPRDLFAIRFAVHNQRYHSIGQFRNDVKNVIESVGDETERTELDRIFKEESRKVFSWFDFDAGKVKDNITAKEDVLLNALHPPHPDHSYAQNFEKKVLHASAKPSLPTAYNTFFDGPENDLRQCIFCSCYGDDMAKACGRLLYCGQDEWAHVNCALWSAEVFEQHDGSLKNVHSAASRGKMLKCDYCRLPGATIGCNTRGCPKNYHFECSKIARCAFQQDRKVYCHKHSHIAKAKLLLDDEFEVERLVSVDNEEARVTRRWQRGVPASDIFVAIGSLTVHKLGRLGLASDSQSYLKPLSYSVTRIFWSTVNAGQKTVYTVTISEGESKAGSERTAVSQHNNNHTIAHAVPDVTAQDEVVAKNPVLKSPPLPNRTDLIEKMHSDQHIGPLSPTRRIAGAPIPVQERLSRRGTYTIISSVNRSLPQAITPYTNRLACSSTTQAENSAPPKTTIPVKISPENPFLNIPPAKPVILNAPEITEPAVEPVMPDPGLTKLTTKKSDKIQYSLPTNTRSIPTSTPQPISTNRVLEESSAACSNRQIATPLFTTRLDNNESPAVDPIKNKSSRSPQLPNDVKRGSSGSAILSVPNTTSQNQQTLKHETETSVTSSSSVGSRSSPSITAEKLANSFFQHSHRSSSSNSSCSSAPLISSVSTPKTSVISLIRGARNAVDVDSEPSVTLLTPRTAACPKKTIKTNSISWVCKRVPTENPAPKSILASPFAMKLRDNRQKSKDYSKSRCDEILEEALSADHDVTQRHNLEKDIAGKSSRECDVSATSTCSVAMTSDSTAAVCENLENAKNSSSASTTELSNLSKMSAERGGELVNDGSFRPPTPSDALQPIRSCEEIKTDSNSNTEHSVAVNGTTSRVLHDSSNVPVIISECSSPEISDGEEEWTSPRKKLRNFALKNPQTTSSIPISTTRLRSKSFEPQIQQKMESSVVETPNGRPITSKKSRRVSDSGSGVDDVTILNPVSGDSTRRYPRRNTYTCLRSFSGVSPNYALASYSHQDKSTRSDKRKNKKSKKNSSTSKQSSKSSKSNGEDNRNATKSSTKLKQNRLQASDKSLASITTSPGPPNAELVDQNHISSSGRAERASVVECLMSDILNCIENPVLSCITFSLSCREKIKNFRHLTASNLLKNPVTSFPERNEPLKHENLTVSGEVNHQPPEKQVVLSNGLPIVFQKGVAASSETVASLSENNSASTNLNAHGDDALHEVNAALVSHREVAPLLSKNAPYAFDLGMGTIAINDSLHSAKRQNGLPAISEEASSLVKNSTLLDDTNTSIEELRGGIENDPLAGMDTSTDTCQDSLTASFLSQTDSNVHSFPPDMARISTPLTKTGSSSPDCYAASTPFRNTTPFQQNFGPLTVPLSAANSTGESSEYPVLNADEVRTVLESSHNLQANSPSNITHKVSTPINTTPRNVPRPIAPTAAQNYIPYQIQNVVNPRFSPVSNVMQRDRVTSSVSMQCASRVPVAQVAPFPPFNSLYVKPRVVGYQSVPLVPIQSSVLTPRRPNPIRDPVSFPYSALVTVALTNATNSPRLAGSQSNVDLSESLIARKSQQRQPVSKYIGSPTIAKTALTDASWPKFSSLSNLVQHKDSPALTSGVNSKLVQQHAHGLDAIPKAIAAAPKTTAFALGTSPQGGVVHQMSVQRSTPQSKSALSATSRCSETIAQALVVQQRPAQNIRPQANVVQQKTSPMVAATPKANELSIPLPSIPELQALSPEPNETVVVSSPNPLHPLVPLDPTPSSLASSISSLEHLIDFYSAKNNLSAEEKAIVRSIITSQIQSNHIPSSSSSTQTLPSTEPIKDKTIPKSVASTSSCSSKKTTPANKRRSSRDQSGNARKRTRKDKHVSKNDFDSVSEAKANKKPEESFLYEIYRKRQLIAKKRNNTVAEAVLPYNIILGKTNASKASNESRLPNSNPEHLCSEPKLVYEIKSEDGYYAKGTDLEELTEQLMTSIHDCWSNGRSNFPSVSLHSIIKAFDFVSLSHDAVRFLVEQLPGARHCPRYKAKYHKHKKTKQEASHINPHGCCRAEQYKGRSKPDMFSFLASKHRLPPEYLPDKSQSDDMLQLSNRRATSMESLPMAMRFRHLRTFSKQAVGVYRSSIHGRGLYCKRDIEDGEMIMEYTGQMIRKDLTDKREQYYESKSIGCYMFRMDDLFVVDATVMGSAARFINHSCEPNCYSRIVHVEGKKHIVIFALRKIYRGEELTYDYKFPIEDETHKIACNCGSKQCRKYMN